MSTIFLSHASADNPAAAELRAFLREHGNHSCLFLDFDPEDGIAAGANWERTLYRKLRACRVLVALVTDDYVSSLWCFAEVALARMEGKTIIPIWSDGLTTPFEKIPSILPLSQGIDLRKDKAAGLLRLLSHLEKLDVLGVDISWPEDQPPYPGLAPFTRADAPIYFGRETEIRTGATLLKRGKAGLLMVLGASGSGKSSFVRAGVLPRLDSGREAANWVIVEPFRPGRDPFSALAEALAHAFAAAGGARDLPGYSEIKASLERWRPDAQADGQPAAEETVARQAETTAEDSPLRRLMTELEALRQSAGEDADARIKAILQLSLEDLGRIAEGDTRGGVRDAATPLIAQAQALKQVHGRFSARVLVVVDQFEELFVAGRDAAVTGRFLDLLKHTLDAEDSPLMVCATMRSDYLDAFQQRNAQHGLIFETMSLSPLGVDGLTRVVEEPARLTSMTFEAGLVRRIVDEANTPDGLPLLSYTLRKLWSACRGETSGEMSVAAYERLGGVTGTLSRAAEEALDAARRIDAAARSQRGRPSKVAALRTAFLALVRIGEDGQYARRSVPWDAPELRPVQDLLGELKSDDKRLLVPRVEDGRELVEVAHEALFRTWSPLARWIAEARADLLFSHRLEQAARDWTDRGRRRDELWTGARLAQAVEYLRAGPVEPTGGRDDPEAIARRARAHEAVTAFVTAGERRRKRRIRRWTAGSLAIAAVIAVFAVVALLAENRAMAEQRASWARQKALEAAGLLEVDAVQSVALARQALCVTQRYDGIVLPEAQQALNQAVHALRRGRFLDPTLPGMGARKSPVTELRFLPGAAGFLTDPASPAVQRLLSVSADTSGTGQLWHIPLGQAARCAGVSPGPAFATGADSVAVDAAGTVLAFGGAAGGISLFDPGNASGRPLPFTLLPRDTGVRLLALSPDGTQLADALEDGRVNLTRMPGRTAGRTLAPVLDADVTALAFTPDGTRLVAATQDGTIRAWRTDTGGTIDSYRIHDAEISALALSGDGFISGDWGGVIKLWRPDVRTELAFVEHRAAISALAIVPGLSALVSAGWDGQVLVWDLDTANVLLALEHDDPVTSIALARGTVVAGNAADGPTSMGELHIAAGTWSGRVRIWTLDLATMELLRTLDAPGHTAPINRVAFSADGTRLATAGDDGRIGLVTLPDQRPELVWREGMDVLETADDHLVAVLRSRDVLVIEAGSGETLDFVGGYGGIADAIAFIPEGAPRIAVRADDIREYYLRAEDLMSCATSLVSPVAAPAPPGTDLDSLCADVPLGPSTRPGEDETDFRSLLAILRGLARLDR